MSEEFRSAVVSTGIGKLGQEIKIGPHTLVSDVPKADGDDAGPSPHDFLLAALGACTSMTITLYARRKQFQLERVQVDLKQQKRDGVH
ncbi:MAG TPA: OsmC family protein, partial [Polyangiaceae bacterium]